MWQFAVRPGSKDRHEGAGRSITSKQNPRSPPAAGPYIANPICARDYIPDLAVMAEGQGTSLYVTFGLSAALNQVVNQSHPARSSGLSLNADWHFVWTQLIWPLHVASMPPLCAPMSTLPHSLGPDVQELLIPTPPPGISKSNWLFTTSPPMLMAWTIKDFPLSALDEEVAPVPVKSNWKHLPQKELPPPVAANP